MWDCLYERIAHTTDISMAAHSHGIFSKFSKKWRCPLQNESGLALCKMKFQAWRIYPLLSYCMQDKLTFLSILSQLMYPLWSMNRRPKYQVSRSPMVLATRSNNCRPVAFHFENRKKKKYSLIVETKTSQEFDGLLLQCVSLGKTWYIMRRISK